MFKLMILPRTKEGLSRAELHHYLEHVHAPLCLSLPTVGGHFTRYVHHYARDTETDPLLGKRVSQHDAFTIIGFENEGSFKASIGAPEYASMVAPDEDRFRERDGSIAMPVEERVLLDGTGETMTLFYPRRKAPGMERAVVARDWERRLAPLLRQSGSPISRYVLNVVKPGVPSPFDILDEVGWVERDPTVLRQQIACLEEGLFDPEIDMAMITERRVFV